MSHLFRLSAQFLASLWLASEVGTVAHGQATRPAATPQPAEPPPPDPALLDLALEPPVLNTSPGPAYADEARDYGMVIGADRTRRGRIWACWVAGGDSPDAYFVLATSADDGRTWSAPRLVVDPPDPPGDIKRRCLVGNVWADPTGRLWLFADQSMGQFDGRAGVWAATCDDPDAANPTWSAPRRIWRGYTMNKPTVLRSGEWLLPLSLWPRDKIKPPAGVRQPAAGEVRKGRRAASAAGQAGRVRVGRRRRDVGRRADAR